MNTNKHLQSCVHYLQALFNASSVAVTIVDADQRHAWFNDAFIEQFGYSRDQLHEMQQWWLLAYPDPRYRARVQKQWASAQANNFDTSRPIRARVKCADGTAKSIHFLARMVDSKIVVLCETLYARETSMQLAQNVFDNASEGILITDERTRIISVNRSFERITHYARHEVIGQTPALLRSNQHEQGFYEQMWKELRHHGHWQGEIWNRRKNGELYVQRQNIDAIKNRRGRLTHYVSIFEDITEIKRQQDQITHMAFHDGLTGLPNRQLLIERIERNIVRSKRDKGRFALLFLDLDRFKQINDSLGHDVGDSLLIVIAARLRGECRIVDTLCRFGGDEFIILIDRIESDESLLKILQRLLERVQTPIPLKNHSLQVSVSIGVVFYPGDGKTAHELIQHADAAMYHAKNSGKNRYCIFDAATNETLHRQLELEMQLHRSLESGAFELFFQPKVNLSENRLEGAEVLLRWKHLGHYIPPSDFITIAEESGVIVPIGAWVLEESVRVLRDHPELQLRLAINVSAKQIHQDDIAQRLEQLCQSCAIDPGTIEIELTESAFLHHPSEAGAMLQRIRELGISIALDDFGTGFSSLSYLKKLPIDVIKIDQSFVRDMIEDGEDAVLVESIIALSRALGKKTVAEGVENEAQLNRLRLMGCDSVQGYHIARPMPLEAFLSWVTDWRRRES